MGSEQEQVFSPGADCYSSRKTVQRCCFYTGTCTSRKQSALQMRSYCSHLRQSGVFGFDLYSGPQEWRRLHQMGRNLEHVNPYGSFLRPVVQPFATIVMQVVLWIHDRLKVNYGWVLIIFGITIRLLLWPLNQGAMRNSLKLQRIQPQLQEIQKKYKSNPEKLQAEMGKLYRDHGMSPFTPLAGCLPMLIPMPVLFALYFVFQNTIEFRGVSFLWMPDLSQKDPLFILPAVMGISMYVLSWISLAICTTESSGKDNGICLSRDDGVFLLATGSWAESVLRGAKSRDTSTTMAHCA